ncbi:MAG TPA: phytanoyl-CoA dioxygenase family protein [Chthonomonadaceae bacterium]|nr:phytanoyl-CoA dioxygenase family protein [Chthonomonadaceae bacterium]
MQTLEKIETASPVTLEEKAAFEERGYHVLRNAFTPEEVQTYREAMTRLLCMPADHPYFSCMMTTDLSPRPADNPHAIWGGFDLPLFDDRFYDLAFHPKIALTMDALIGPDINLYETSFVSKIPGFPGTYRDWHQDSEYFDPQVNDRNAAVIFYLHDMDPDSGATWVIPGTHKLGPLPHTLPGEAVSSKAREVADKHLYAPQGISFEFKAGDALFFLARVIHKAGGNNSDTTRTNIIYNYVRKDNLDLGGVPRYIGTGIPVTRNGKVYVPGQH